MSAAKEKNRVDFVCVPCGKIHPISELGVEEIKHGVPYRRCKMSLENRKDGDLEAVKNAVIENEDDQRVWSYGQCEVCQNTDNVTLSMGKYRCQECENKRESMKDKCFVGESKPVFETIKDRYAHIVAFGEKLKEDRGQV